MIRQTALVRFGQMLLLLLPRHSRVRVRVRPSVLRHLSPSLVDDACIACNRRAETFFNWTLGAIG